VRNIRLYVKHVSTSSAKREETEQQRRWREKHVDTLLARRYQSVWLTWMCANPFCRQWTMDGAYRTGNCNFCQAPRVAR